LRSISTFKRTVSRESCDRNFTSPFSVRKKNREERGKERDGGGNEEKSKSVRKRVEKDDLELKIRSEKKDAKKQKGERKK
jgi:hypothetical protein